MFSLSRFLTHTIEYKNISYLHLMKGYTLYLCPLKA